MSEPVRISALIDLAKIADTDSDALRVASMGVGVKLSGAAKMHRDDAVRAARRLVEDLRREAAK